MVRKPAGAALAAVTIFLACAGEEPAPPPALPAEAAAHALSSGELLYEWPSDGETLLELPSALLVVDGAAYIADRGAARVYRIGADGRLENAFGAPGEGPGELRNPQRIQVDGRGRVWIGDAENQRIMLYEDGSAARTIPLSHWSAAHNFVILQDTMALYPALNRRAMFTVATEGSSRDIPFGDIVPPELVEAMDSPFRFSFLGLLMVSLDDSCFALIANRRSVRIWKICMTRAADGIAEVREVPLAEWLDDRLAASHDEMRERDPGSEPIPLNNATRTPRGIWVTTGILPELLGVEIGLDGGPPETVPVVFDLGQDPPSMFSALVGDSLFSLSDTKLRLNSVQPLDPVP